MYGVVGPGRWARKAVGRFSAAAAAANSDVSSTLPCDFRGARTGVEQKLCGVTKLRNRLPRIVRGELQLQPNCVGPGEICGGVKVNGYGVLLSRLK